MDGPGDEFGGRRPPNYLRAWREYRRMTQGQLAEAVGTTGSVISLLESGARGLGDRWLHKLAAALRTRPGHLLELHPQDAPRDILEIWADVPPSRRDQAITVLKTFQTPKPSGEAETPVTEKPLTRGAQNRLVRQTFRSKAPASNNTDKTKSGGGSEDPDGV